MTEDGVNNYRAVEITNDGMIVKGNLDFNIEKSNIMSEIMSSPELARIEHKVGVHAVSIVPEDFGKFGKIMKFYKYYSGDIKITINTRADNPGLMYVGTISHDRVVGNGDNEKSRAKLIYEPSLARGEKVITLNYSNDNPKQKISQGLGKVVFYCETNLIAKTLVKFEPCSNFKMFDCSEPTRPMETLKFD